MRRREPPDTAGEAPRGATKGPKGSRERRSELMLDESHHFLDSKNRSESSIPMVHSLFS